MSSASEAVKDRFRAQFNPVLSQRSEVVENNDNGIVPLETRKRRRAITNAEKKAVQDYYFDPANRKPAHKYIQEWFLQEFWHLPSYSTISEVLSPSFAHLDSGTTRPSLKKQRHAQWTDLEDALIKWQQRMEQKKATVMGDILKEMAAVLWEKLLQYVGQEVPKFSIR